MAGRRAEARAAWLLADALRWCRRKGFAVDDPSYGSAVGWGVATAVARWQRDRGRTLRSYARLLAQRECLAELFRLIKWHWLPDAEAAGLLARDGSSPSDRPAWTVDDVLSLVSSTDGRTAARLLGVRPRRLERLVADVRRYRAWLALGGRPEDYRDADDET